MPKCWLRVTRSTIEGIVHSAYDLQLFILILNFFNVSLESICHLSHEPTEIDYCVNFTMREVLEKMIYLT